jgi:hypothetical protein
MRRSALKSTRPMLTTSTRDMGVRHVQGERRSPSPDTIGILN